MVEDQAEELEPTEDSLLEALRVLGRNLEAAQEVLTRVYGGLNAARPGRSPSAEEIYAEGMLYVIDALRSFLLGYEDSLRRLHEWRRREPPDLPASNADDIPF